MQFAARAHINGATCGWGHGVCLIVAEGTVTSYRQFNIPVEVDAAAAFGTAGAIHNFDIYKIDFGSIFVCHNSTGLFLAIQSQIIQHELRPF